MMTGGGGGKQEADGRGGPPDDPGEEQIDRPNRLICTTIRRNPTTSSTNQVN